MLVRTRVSEIRELGRATQGVTLIALDNGTKLSGLQRIVENDAPAESSDEAEDGNISGNTSNGGGNDAGNDNSASESGPEGN